MGVSSGKVRAKPAKQAGFCMNIKFVHHIGLEIEDRLLVVVR